jgi:hypothetical protein
MIPAGYKYSKPSDPPISLLAVLDAGPATSVITVIVSKIEVDRERALEKIKEAMRGANSTTKFSETMFAGTRMVQKRRVKLYRANVSSQRANGVKTKAAMIYFEDEGKLFMLNCVARDDMFQGSATTFARVIDSFGPA